MKLQEQIEKRLTENNLNQDLYHLLIEGDNLDVLNLLLKDYNNLINIIYIDPPYNTGKTDFVYTDKFTHDEWLVFMRPRLEKAKQLLSEDGVIFISIDDNELVRLRLLCDDIFGEDNFVSNIVCKTNSGNHKGAIIKNSKEYCLVYRKTDKLIFSKQKSDMNNYKLVDESGNRYCLRTFDMHGLKYVKGLDYIIKAPDGSNIYPGKSEEDYLKRQAGIVDTRDWCWTLSEKEFEKRRLHNNIVFKNTKNGWRVYYKSYWSGKETIYSDYYDLADNRNAVKELKEIFGGRCVLEYTKPLDYIKYLLNLHTNKDALVLDFFAGSGTTGQAVLELNQEDAGNRKFILVQNNENNICEEITYQRLKTVIIGQCLDGSSYKRQIKANLRYLKLDL